MLLSPQILVAMSCFRSALAGLVACELALKENGPGCGIFSLKFYFAHSEESEGLILWPC